MPGTSSDLIMGLLCRVYYGVSLNEVVFNQSSPENEELLNIFLNFTVEARPGTVFNHRQNANLDILKFIPVGPLKMSPNWSRIC